ncbi:hypothetical protein COI_0205 [Mannheimia haemolytica serotype A2 str. OVINE]|nr:hypothetical protein COI_0205 [Mannheimia haemolytica serotype A2 str. OVINE]
MSLCFAQFQLRFRHFFTLTMRVNLISLFRNLAYAFHQLLCFFHLTDIVFRHFLIGVLRISVEMIKRSFRI